MFNIEGNNITITKGDTAIIVFSVDNYILTTGDKVTFTVKKNINDTLPAIIKEILSFEEGKAKIGLTKSDTNLRPGTYIYDIQVDLTDGRVSTVIAPSSFLVEKGVTD